MPTAARGGACLGRDQPCHRRNRHLGFAGGRPGASPRGLGTGFGLGPRHAPRSVGEEAQPARDCLGFDTIARPASGRVRAVRSSLGGSSRLPVSARSGGTDSRCVFHRRPRRSGGRRNRLRRLGSPVVRPVCARAADWPFMGGEQRHGACHGRHGLRLSGLSRCSDSSWTAPVRAIADLAQPGHCGWRRTQAAGATPAASGPVQCLACRSQSARLHTGRHRRVV
ncbi:hypothetical protein GALL_437360 [mine drainage metagenome]|uniref:Uncharacterized protein n=1 Tax=mine drainage metagenome TaxID=410659 RepID=A0A1J5PTZ9_9ZZZZ